MSLYVVWGCGFLIGGASLHFGPHNHSSAHDDMSCGGG